MKDCIINEEEKEIVEYGLEMIGNMMLGIGIVSVIGLLQQCVWESLTLWVILVPLRKNAGGYHAKTRGRCFIFSTVIIFMAVMCIKNDWHKPIYTMILVIFSLIIFSFAPVDTANKELGYQEICIYRKRTRVILLMDCILYLVAGMNQWMMLRKIISMAVMISGLLVLLGKMSYFERRKNL